jgi:hypothetical protein
MQNSSKYRKPPIKRTRDSFIDDQNSIENPRVDFGKARHREVRRDKDRIRNLGITLYDVDFAIKTFIDQTMQLKIEDNGEYISVPTLYANSEKWASIQKNGFLKDKKGKTMVPLISFRRSNVTMTNELKRNKVASTNQLTYVMKSRYSKLQPYDRFSTLYNVKQSQEYFVTPIPDYVQITYDFIAWCEYQQQLNYLVEQFVYFTGQSFGDKNFFKFSTNMDSVTMEDNNTTGQDRVVRATFQIVVHAYLLPKEIAGETTTRRIVAPNKISFTSEAFSSINEIFSGVSGKHSGEAHEPFNELNIDNIEELEEIQRRLNNFTETSINRSPDVYPTEID